MADANSESTLLRIEPTWKLHDELIFPDAAALSAFDEDMPKYLDELAGMDE